MKPGNAVRHELRLPDVGRLKANGMEQILIETNPYVEIEKVYGTRIDREKFETVMRDHRRPPTLVISLTANRAVGGQVDELARRCASGVPVLHAWLQAQAQVLRAFVYRPGRTACTYCNEYHAAELQPVEAGGYVRVPDEVADEPFFEASCASPAFPGAGNANALASHVVAEMALDILHDRLPDEESHWVFAGNRIEERVPGFPVPPLCTKRLGFRPHAECPVCSRSVPTPDLKDSERAEYDREMARATGAA